MWARPTIEEEAIILWFHADIQNESNLEMRSENVKLSGRRHS
jgi:hypothetical protein